MLYFVYLWFCADCLRLVFVCGFGMAIVCRGFVAGLVGRFPFWVVGVWCDERVGL